MSAVIEDQLRRAITTIRSLRAEVETLKIERRPPIAVLGVGCRMPGGIADVGQLWEALAAGRDAIVEVPKDRWDIDAWFDSDPDVAGRMNSRWGGFLDGIDRFDPGFFELSAREANGMDPQQRLLLEVSWEALEDACLAADKLPSDTTGVFVGINASEYYEMGMADPAAIDAHAISGGVASVAAGRISYLMGLNGPAVAIDTACSSSLAAVHLAVQSLRTGESDLALAGGVYTVLRPNLTVGLSKLHMMAADGRCKSFDAAADGFVQGEGCGVVVLKRLADAVADRDPIRAVIRGTAMNQDGRSGSLTAPSRRAQVQVIKSALEDAGVGAGEVGYVETHGTGTALGDPIEVHALADVLGRDRETPVVLGALKSNIGHLGPAAGIAGLIKAVAVVERGRIPPNLHFRTLNPNIELDGFPVQFPDKEVAWPEGAVRRIAGVSSFGFSGTNVHAVLEAHSDDPAEPASGAQVYSVSARSPAALEAAIERHAAALPGLELAAASRTSLLGRRAFEYRMTVVGRTTDEIIEQLRSKPMPDRTTARARLGLIFGALSPEPGAKLARGFPVIEDTLNGAAGIADLDNAEAKVTALCWAVTRQLEAWGVTVIGHAGTGVGAVAAEAAAGRLGWEESLRRVSDDFDSRPRSERSCDEELKDLGCTILLRVGGEAGSETTLPTLSALSDEDPVEGLLRALAGLHDHGVVVDWRAVLAEGPRARLPSYPFQRKSFWRAESVARHPISRALPGIRQTLPPAEGPTPIAFKLPVSLASSPWLGDHRVHGRAVVPGAFQIACLAEAWKEIQSEKSSDSRITGLTFAQPLTLPEAEEIEIWTLIFPDGSARLLTQIGGAWSEHATATIESCAPADPENLDLVALGASCTEEIAPGPWRDELATLGIEIGPAFQGLRTLRRGGDKALGEVHLPEVLRGKGTGTYPAVLDACLQVAGGTIRDVDQGALLPIGIDRIEVRDVAPDIWSGPLHVAAQCTNRGAVISTDLSISDHAGRMIMRVTGLHVRRAPRELLEAVGTANDLFHEIAWRPLPAIEDADHAEILLVANDLGTAEALAALLPNRAVRVAPPDALPDFGEGHLVVDLLDWGEDGTIESVGRSLALARHAIRSGARLMLVTDGAFGMDAGLHRPWHAARWGLAATLALEHPELALRRCEADTLSSVAAEVRARTDEDIVAWDSGERLAARLTRASDRSTPLGPAVLRGTVVITGGLGGVGRRLAAWAARRGAETLVLVSRSAGSAAPEWIEELDVPVRLVAADLGVRADVKALFGAVGDLPPVRTVIHAAGGRADGLLAEIDPVTLRQGLAAKAQGALWLDEVSRDLDLDHFILVSSVASVLGAAGQGSYAAANALLDALARRRCADGQPGRSIAWGRWADSGMAADLDAAAARRVDALGILEMSDAEALAALDAAFTGSSVAPVVARVDWMRFAERHPSGRAPALISELIGPAHAMSTPAAETDLASLDDPALDADARWEMLRRWLVVQAAGILGATSSSDIDSELPLIQLGLDSLMAVELRNRLGAALGTPPSIALLLGGASLAVLAERLLADRVPTAPNGPAEAEEWEEIRL